MRFSTLLFALLLPLPAHAFILIGDYDKGETPLSRALVWTNRTVTFQINTDLTAYGGSIAAEITSAEFIDAIEAAVNSWASVCGSNITVEIGANTATTVDANDGINTIVWDNRTTGEGNDIANTNVLAVAWSAWTLATDTYVDCDIQVNGEVTGDFGVNGESNKYDLVGVLAHEIGHCLGLDHSVEPPTFTSDNPILLAATMASTVSAGDLGPRTISQDEIDAMECVNPEGKDSRSGDFCSSYHGTNGNGELSGTVDGGPAYNRVCGEGVGTAMTTLPQSGGGCAANAIASTGSNKASDLWWPLPLGLAVALTCLFRLARAWLPLLLLVPSLSHAGDFELWYANNRGRGGNVDDTTQITSNEATFASLAPEIPKKLDRYQDLGGSIFFQVNEYASVGPFFRYNIENHTSQKAFNTSGIQLLDKDTAIYGWTAGPAFRFYFRNQEEGSIHPYLDLHLGMGRYYLVQQMTDSGGLSRLRASATALEGSAYLGLRVKLFSGLFVFGKGGYTMIKTTPFVVKQTSGSRYAAFQPNRRLAVNATEEVRLGRTGLSYMAGLDFPF